MAPTAQPKQYQMLGTYPVGAFYIQFPSADSNTASEAFPTTLYPAAIFGGTWGAMWNTEGLFFKTQGDPLSQTDGENNVRTSGLQTDMMQGHYHRWESGGAQDAGLADSNGFNSFYNPGAKNSDSAYIKAPTANATDGTPRTGKETRGRNRLWIIWKRTA